MPNVEEFLRAIERTDTAPKTGRKVIRTARIDGPRLRSLRQERGFSLRALAEQTGIAIDSIQKTEHRGRPLRPDQAERIAEALGVTVADLSQRTEEAV